MTAIVDNINQSEKRHYSICYFCGMKGLNEDEEDPEILVEHIGGRGNVPVCKDRKACIKRQDYKWLTSTTPPPSEVFYG